MVEEYSIEMDDVIEAFGAASRIFTTVAIQIAIAVENWETVFYLIPFPERNLLAQAVIRRYNWRHPRRKRSWYSLTRVERIEIAKRYARRYDDS